MNSEDNSKITDFKPYVPADKVLPEMTVPSFLLGVILAVVFGAANAYLGLRVGMTVSASIPAAVISMGIIRRILKRDSILENNMVRPSDQQVNHWRQARSSRSRRCLCGHRRVRMFRHRLF